MGTPKKYLKGFLEIDKTKKVYQIYKVNITDKELILGLYNPTVFKLMA